MKRRALFAAPLALALLIGGCQKEAASNAGAEKPAEKPADDHAAHAAAAGTAATKGPADAKARAFFVFPQDGSKVYSPVAVAFGVEGMTVTPAGQAMDDQTKGHHHVIINGAPIPAGTAVPADETHIHYGKGETSAKLELPPGKHTLTMQFADGAHLSYGPEMSATITVEVVEGPKETPRVFFVEPQDGAKVRNPVKVKFGLEGMTVRPAGEDPLDKTSGHHHIVIDGEPIALGTAVPADERNIHYGLGQTEAELTLPPGKHTLTMQFADGAHLSYGPEMAATITVEVQP